MEVERDSIFLDTNVVLDHLADRQPFSENAHRIFALAEFGSLELHISALSFCNLYYLLRKLQGHEVTVALLAKLAMLVQVTPVGDREVRAALGSGFNDFEDAVQLESASTMQRSGVLVSRNARDFAGGRMQVLSPEEYLASRIERGI
ncbi:MAG: PIN domain-containing protein [Opitutaceae bacterium]|nr:PIN domain-containing protein [Opitutaceae bacterium]